MSISMRSPLGELPNPPADLDGDGLFEDINHDGNVTVSDVQALFANRDGSVAQDNAGRFDFTQDGQLNIVDIQHLFVGLGR
ncbi:hypothetical protein [Haloferax profundi]|uniref:Dockerin domain-containing protein n=1 Tax=Haloferax profundi TaxID=1544718 RepID=A0A0W1SLI7_9EURY|nr:hypothetical protein [Haloferax profundi]KTG27105.1 hypothetical protein AUR66_14925 [Haloferax profundi]